MNSVGKNIRLLRVRKGWRQEEFASRMNISLSALSKIETGLTDLTLSRLEQLAAVFGLTPAQLVAYRDASEMKMAGDMEELTRLLEQRDAELLTLQKKVIGLLEELRRTREAERG